MALVRWLVRLGLLAALAAAMAVMVVGVNRDPDVDLEGPRLHAAQRWILQDVPLEHFYYQDVPGPTHLAALVLRPSALNILAYRWLIFALAVLKVLLIWCVSRRLAGPWAATAAAAVAVCVIWRTPVNAAEPALALVLLSVLAAWRWSDGGRWRWLVAAGAAIGLVGWFQWQWCVLAVAGGVVWAGLSPGDVEHRAGTWRRLAVVGVLVLTASMVLAAGLLLFFGQHVALFWEQGVAQPFRLMWYRALPLPPPLPSDSVAMVRGDVPVAVWGQELWRRTLIWGPALMLIGAAVVAFFRRGPERPDWLQSRRTGLLALAAVMFYVYVFVRSDWLHALPLVQLSLPLSACVWAEAGLWNRRDECWVARVLVGAVWLLMAGGPVYWQCQQHQVERVAYTVPRAEGMVGPAEQVRCYEGCVREVRRLTGRPIFVGARRHDAVQASDELFYFLAERRSATPLYRFEPGLTDTDAAQQQIVADLQRRRVEVIVLWDPQRPAEPNRTYYGGGGRVLDRFIDANYAHRAWFCDRRYEILGPTSASAPVTTQATATTQTADP